MVFAAKIDKTVEAGAFKKGLPQYTADEVAKHHTM